MSRWNKTKSYFSLKNDYSVKPIGLKWRSNTFFIVAVVGIGMWTDLFLYGVVVPIVPFLLEDRLAMPYDQVQSNTSMLLAVYGIASVLMCPITGAFSDKINSRQIPFLGGLTAMMLSTVLFFRGTSLPVLVLARILQGASSACVWTVGVTMAVDTVGHEHLGKTIGTLFSFTSFAELSAPAVGGALYRQSGTNAVLALCLALLGVDFVTRALVIEKKPAARYYAADNKVSENHQAQAPNSDVQQCNTQDPSEESPLLHTTQEQQQSSDHENDDDNDAYLVPRDQPALIMAAPILYPLMHSSALAAANTLTFTQALIVAGYDATVPTYARELYDFDSLKAGLLFIPLSTMNLICGPLAGWAVDRYGTKFGGVVGFLSMVPSLVLLRLPRAEPFPEQAILWAVLLGLIGPGISLSGSPGMIEAAAVLDAYHKRNPELFGETGPYAQLYGVNSMMFSLGLAVGPMIAGALKESIGYGNMNAIIAGVSTAAAVIAFIWVGGPPRLSRVFKKG